MKKVIKLKENDIHNIVKILLEQDDDEWVKVSPERYTELMKYAGYYAPGIANLPEFRGKKIWITGNLNLSNTPTKSLDGIKYIEGQLNINKTEPTEETDETETEQTAQTAQDDLSTQFSKLNIKLTKNYFFKIIVEFSELKLVCLT